MRVGLFAHELDPGRATGIARYTRGLAHGLEGVLPETGDSLVVVTAKGCGAVPQPHREIGIRRRHLYGGWLFLSTPRAEWLVPGLDLVHVTAPVIPVPTRRPLVVTLHDLMPITHPHWYPPREVSIFKRCVSWMEDDVAVVIVPTETVRRDALEHTRIDDDRIVVTGEGVELDHFAGTDSSTVLDAVGISAGDYLLYLGQVSERKNLLTLLEALPGSPWPLVVVGPDGFGAERVRTSATASGVDVRFLGRLPDADVGTLMRSARALVHPSLYEGFGLTVVEAMAMGTPVLVSSGGALGEVVGEGGLVVAANDAQGWRAALARLSHEDDRITLAEAGRVRALAWNWTDAAYKTRAAYLKAL